MQREVVGDEEIISEMDVQWTGECTYLLFNPKAIKGRDDFSQEIQIDTLYNEIVEISGDTFLVKSSSRMYDFEVLSVMIKVHVN